MALHQRRDREELVNPAGGGPLPKLKVKRGADGKLEVKDPEPKAPPQAEIRPDERPPEAGDPRTGPDPHTAGF